MTFSWPWIDFLTYKATNRRRYSSDTFFVYRNVLSPMQSRLNVYVLCDIQKRKENARGCSCWAGDVQRMMLLNSCCVWSISKLCFLQKRLLLGGYRRYTGGRYTRRHYYYYYSSPWYGDKNRPWWRIYNVDADIQHWLDTNRKNQSCVILVFRHPHSQSTFGIMPMKIRFFSFQGGVTCHSCFWIRGL